jgi:murein L,D-transpeptidase YcbB/YkuD
VLDAIKAAGFSDAEKAELQGVYAETSHRLLWSEPALRSALLKALVSLESEGIDIERVGPLPGYNRDGAIEGDVLATHALLRAAHIVAGDAMETNAIPGWHIEPRAPNLVPSIAAVVMQGRIGDLLRELRPQNAAYNRLRSSYVSYMRLSAERWEPIALTTARIVEADDPRMAVVARALKLLGDLSEGYSEDRDIPEAIKRFQQRHGLAIDGRVGPATLAELNVPPSARAAQIAVNLEYWRLLPRSWPSRYVVVNTAAAHLDVISNDISSFTTPVIVGDPNHATPITNATITGVTFNPPWTVPYSIATKEMLPRLRRDPGYLERNSIEILERPEDPYGRGLDWTRYSSRNFPFQLRQVPGPGNALGLVKFEMPNAFNVYLHDTNNKSLFDKNERALSHGCVRVKCARELAEHLIDDPSVWVNTGLLNALDNGETYRVQLKEGLPVFLLYFTAFVDETGTLNFRPDVYGRDAAMRRAFSQQRPLPTATSSKGVNR